jgi:apolipoprotein N-acyltransferase
MGVDDNLVKLASFGTAGISILAVFITGVIIYKLPNDVSKEKTGILKFFIVSCFVFVVLGTGSGIANALFNKSVIDEKEEKINEVSTKYENERKSWLNYQTDVTKKITNIENQLRQPGVNKELLLNDLKLLNTKTREMKFAPIDKR